MFSKRHYVAIARTLSESKPSAEWSECMSQWRLDVISFSAMFKSDNIMFDVDQFEKAVGLDNVKKIAA